MKIKFENCLVELYRIDRGVVVDGPEGVTFITDICTIDKIGEDIIASFCTENAGVHGSFYSDEITWLKPH